MILLNSDWMSRICLRLRVSYMHHMMSIVGSPNIGGRLRLFNIMYYELSLRFEVNVSYMLKRMASKSIFEVSRLTLQGPVLQFQNSRQAKGTRKSNLSLNENCL